ncbi:extracellular solute-binding protein [Lederbergia ruris]|uniref:sugar ABC transporter substrate-binding protein n=1 Tax=Lederbergia ruris TaxID=217495 RepID=UPI0039A29C0D
MLKKSKLFGFLLIPMLLTLLVACGPDRPTRNTNDSDNSGTNGDINTNQGEELEKPDELTIWVNDNERDLKAAEEVTEKYTEETGIVVKIIPYALTEQEEALSLDAPAGRGPDLFYLGDGEAGSLYEKGLAAPLELTEEQKAGYNKSALNALSYKGVQEGIPASVETTALFYNKDLIPEVPETWEELMEIAKELTNVKNGEYGFLMPAYDFFFMNMFLDVKGGYIFGEDNKGSYNADDIGLASDGAVEGAKLIQSWFEDDNVIPPGITGDVMNGLFEDGKVGAVVSGPWSISSYKKALGDSLGVVPFPTIDGKHLRPFLGVVGWFVSEYSENKYWATDLALFMTNTENTILTHEMNGKIPARTDVEVSDELYNGILQQTEYAVMSPNIPERNLIWDPMKGALEFILNGDDPKEVLEEAVQQIEEQVRQFGGKK